MTALPYRPLPLDKSSAEDEEILLEVDRTIGRVDLSERMDQPLLPWGTLVKKQFCSRRRRISNLCCFICIILLIANIIVINTSVRYGLEWMATHSYLGHNPPENGDGISSGNTHQVEFSLRGAQRLVHLDLKGGPPKLEYLKQLIPLLAKLGATGVLVEYEDMFPYDGSLGDISAGNAYTHTDVRTIRELCAANNLTVIPLVQTLGHMGFVLKYEKYASLREVAAFPEFLNPRLAESELLVYNLIDQMVAAHPNMSHIHIGCDEVSVLEDAEVYLSHVTKVACYVRSHHQGVSVVIWDDMLRDMDVSLLQRHNLSALVEIMVWVYVDPIETRVSHQVWDKYAQVFSTVWIASAFKGSTGPLMYYTDIDVHLSNHLAWQSTLAWLHTSHPSLGVSGLALTGWARYNHFSGLCELIPAGLPSLVLCLQTVLAGQYDPSVLQKASTLLQCEKPFPVTFNDTSPGTEAPPCEFPGHRIYELLTFTFRSIVVQFNKYFILLPGARSKGALNHFSLSHNYSSPYSLKKVVLGPAKSLQKRIKSFRDEIQHELEKVFNPDLVTEWTEEYVDMISDQLELYMSEARALSSRRVWPRRPLS